MQSMTVRNTAQISAAVRSSASTGAALQSSLGAAIQAVNSSMVVSIAGKASETKHFWLGGCTTRSNSCWQDMCLNGVEVDTARPKFYKRTNTRMRALVPGFYRMNFWVMISRNWAHISVRLRATRIRWLSLVSDWPRAPARPRPELDVLTASCCCPMPACDVASARHLNS